ncbi:Asparagine synthase (glutamine-hydrolyzing) [Halapricum desulfuricans]|uniref:Asparagine synthase (Glutamine-hydrolyzing) n=1 Tax=Halapricum desulfuricans TaxID=2841257 RepID=A0A897NIS0_9EURY|nr:Asparagine synthase (glutamine-hydrolyzing) [Halapricum desulfuricans]
MWLSRRSDWARSGDVSTSGRAFEEGELLSGIALCERFEGVSSLDSFADTLADLNGFFAVVIEHADAVFLGVDHVRSIPLYYAPGPGRASDDPRWLGTRLGNPDNDPLAESELLAGGTVLDNRTLVPGLLTVRPGEAVQLLDSETRTRQYTDYRPTTEPMASDPGRERLEAAIDAAFDRFSTVVGDRQIALSLSGGHDSRLVATELVRRDHDVLAFSFGRSGYEDVTVAENVAAALDVPWTFVEYSTDSWREWYRSPERARYVEETFGYDSIPNYGTVPALSRLRETGSIESDAVCTSGQTVVGMSEDVPDELTVPAPTEESLLAAILRYWRRWEWDNPAFDDAVRERVTADLPDDVGSLPAAFAAFERWKWADRHVKYFVAEVRQYDFHDLDWWLPLWDREVVTAWTQVPFAGRRGKQVYRELVDRRFAEVAGIDLVEANGLTAEPRAPTTADQLVDWAAERLVDSPIAPLLAPVYWSLQRRRSAYGDHSLGWYGIVPPDLFATLYSGREDIHALQTLDTVGRASFLEGTVIDPPRDGVLSLPYPDGE